MHQSQQKRRLGAALHVGLIALVSISLSGCVKSESDTQSANNQELPMLSDSTPQTDSISDAKDALQDAERAITELDFRLLAFTNKVIHFPGIDSEAYPADWIEKHCGIRYLQGTGDILKSAESGTSRSELKRYTSIYNPRILQACLELQKKPTDS